ncbi:MAG: hypothetical protein KGI50_01880 [Patescibacteria group bacterium]|nr:hypothetical protein [Patescibacteria group bacterium]MDE2437906.1 hypothetical protein [Patescibacteria group bacterium]
MKLFSFTVIVLVVLVLVVGFYFVGSPATARFERLDAQRVSDLELLQNDILNYWSTKKTVPAKLSDLNDIMVNVITPRDPATREEYGYTASGTNAFTLCATFALPSSSYQGIHYGTLPSVPQPVALKTAPAYPGEYGDIWYHGQSGYVCFDRTIDPGRYVQTP